ELHEEIDRLPERYRAAVVLCGLEGQTHEEAARRLGWPLGTLKVRLMRGRARLRARLVRRGLAPAAAALAATGGDASGGAITAGPAARMGTVSPRVDALARTPSRDLLMTRLFTVTGPIVVAGGLLCAAGWGLHATRAAVDPPRDVAAPAPAP